MPSMNDRPITNVRRASSRREAMICRPFTKMTLAEKSNAAPITGRGMITKNALALGKNARRQSSFTVVTGHEDPAAGADGSVDWEAVAVKVGGTIVILMGVA